MEKPATQEALQILIFQHCHFWFYLYKYTDVCEVQHGGRSVIQTSGSAEHDVINIPNFIKIGEGADGYHADKLDGANQEEIIGSFVYLPKHPSFSSEEFIR